MNHSIQAQCLGKFKYPTFELAQMVAGRKRDAKMTPYHCPHCHFYHIGNTPQKLGKYVKGKKDVLSEETNKPDGKVKAVDWPQGRRNSRRDRQVLADDQSAFQDGEIGQDTRMDDPEERPYRRD